MPHPVLFVLQDASAPTNNYTTTSTSGVATSTRLIAEALRDEGFDIQIAAVSKPEEIAHVVRVHQPRMVIVETLWVDPKYFVDILKEFPDIRFAVREHSESCFRVLEPHAFGWIIDYLSMGIEVISNSARSMNDVQYMAMAADVPPELSTWGPNIYPVPDEAKLCSRKDTKNDVVHIGCFGAVRLMKNHITQALAAIMFGERVGKTVHFHLNGYDIPGYVDPVLNNLREMFAKFPRHKLVEHGWMDRETFLGVIRSMDIISQVSFTETFNIVAADAMYEGVPIIVSDEISWVGDYAHRDPNSAHDIASGYVTVWEERCMRHLRLRRQRRDMERYSALALVEWFKRLA